MLELPEPEVHGHEESAPRNQHTGQDNKDRRRLHDRRVDKRNQEESFEASVAAWLNHVVLTGKIAQLFAVAPPRTLGILRQHYHVALKEKLLGELDREHTHDKIELLREALIKG